MNKHILNIEIQEFINHNLDSDINTILLKGTGFAHVETPEIVSQIEAKKRCKKKLPTWYNTEKIYYPNKLNIEQTSSELTAKYKSELIKGNNIIDITGGFGVDCFYFSKRFKNVVHCEINAELSEIVGYNYGQLQVSNTETINENGLKFLKTSGKIFDWIYIDPSRRHESKGKVFFLKDCLPNVPENLGLLFNHTENLMVKTSPLLDISAGIGELKYVKYIYILAVNNEVKELLWILEKGFSEHISIYTVNIKKNGTETFSFKLKENIAKAPYSKPLTFLYEPNVAILKSGGFHQIAEALNVYKLHQHSHLYTSDTLTEFPGRTFWVEKVVPYSKKQIKTLGIKKANITVRNFPENVVHLHKKFKISHGGDVYLFFTTSMNDEKIMIVARKNEQY